MGKDTRKGSFTWSPPALTPPTRMFPEGSQSPGLSQLIFFISLLGSLSPGIIESRPERGHWSVAPPCAVTVALSSAGIV